MSMNRREFLQVLAVAAAGGMSLHSELALAEKGAAKMYDLPRSATSACCTSPTAMPSCCRSTSASRTSTSVSATSSARCRIWSATPAQAFRLQAEHPRRARLHLPEFRPGGKTYGKVGGFAHLATLVKRMKASRPGALLLDGGDTWQGSGTALWTNAQDMVDACKALGVTCHDPALGIDLWRGAGQGNRGKGFRRQDRHRRPERQDHRFRRPGVQALRDQEHQWRAGGHHRPGLPLHADRQPALAGTELELRHPGREHAEDGRRSPRSRCAQVVVVLSHNGMDVDLKMASRVRGIDAIMGGHTHDGVPAPVVVKNAGGQTLVTNAGSNGKFLGVLDFDVRNGKVADFRYKLLPVFANLLPADKEMQALIDKARAPHLSKLNEKLAVTEGRSFAAATSTAPSTSSSSTR
jgi:sulfur-oxidizing protein SoxB